MKDNKRLTAILANELARQLQEYTDLRAVDRLLTKQITAIETYIEQLKKITLTKDADKRGA